MYKQLWEPSSYWNSKMESIVLTVQNLNLRSDQKVSTEFQVSISLGSKVTGTVKDDRQTQEQDHRGLFIVTKPKKTCKINKWFIFFKICYLIICTKQRVAFFFNWRWVSQKFIYIIIYLHLPKTLIVKFKKLGILSLNIFLRHWNTISSFLIYIYQYKINIED